MRTSEMAPLSRPLFVRDDEVFSHSSQAKNKCEREKRASSLSLRRRILKFFFALYEYLKKNCQKFACLVDSQVSLLFRQDLRDKFRLEACSLEFTLLDYLPHIVTFFSVLVVSDQKSRRV